MLDNLFNFREILTLVLIFVPLELLLPARPGQRTFRRYWLNDSFYMLFNGIIVRFGFLLLIGTVLNWWGPIAPGGFVARQPLWLQVVGAFIFVDAAVYAVHRMFHAVPWLWRFHAVHHSIEDLDWLAGYRVHPVDQIIHSTASYLPLFLLGFPVEAIVAHGAIYLIHAHLLHSNTRLGFGPLRHVFASPKFHHWHHANHAEWHDRNFAPSLTWLDRLFGTLHLPADPPTRFGTDDPVPPDYLRQLAWPMVRQDRR